MFSDFPLSPSFFFFFAELRFSFYFSPCCIEAASRWDAAPTHLYKTGALGRLGRLIWRSERTAAVHTHARGLMS